ncbi:hypothetical protein GALL_112610 [mine drainage metagenome]|uniref:Uncharacterized protein n=1 Tax=mine drainage metagenome TaxID=410659 RepID=A0A1J5T3A1_9ZZZZ
MWKSRVIWIATIALILGIISAFYFASARLDDRQIRISANPWVGFTPLIYAQEKGWLEQTQFKFLWQVDLSENSRLYERGLAQGFTATQYEMLHFKDYSHIKPVFLIDRSAGADAILSNFTLEQLRQASQPINVYLELGSLNEDFFHAFVEENKLDHLRFTFINSDQKVIAQIMPSDAPMVAISYAPYVSELTRHGFINIASTKTLRSFFVIDALFVDERFLIGRQDEYRDLQNIFNRAKDQLHQDSREYYQVVRGYLEGQSYEEFMATTQQIAWVSPDNSAPLIRQLKMQNVPTNNLLP